MYLRGYLVYPELSLLDKTRIQAQVLVPVCGRLRAELGRQGRLRSSGRVARLVKQLFASMAMNRRQSAAEMGRCTRRWPRSPSGKSPSACCARTRKPGIQLTSCPLPILSRARRAELGALWSARPTWICSRRRQGRIQPRPDHHAGRALLHLPLQVHLTGGFGLRIAAQARPTGQGKTGRRESPGLQERLSAGLFQRGADRVEIGAELGANALHRSNDGNGDAGRDKPYSMAVARILPSKPQQNDFMLTCPDLAPGTKGFSEFHR